MYKLGITALLFFITFSVAHAQELHQELQGVWRAEVVEVTDEQEILVPGTNVRSEVQMLNVRLLEGDRKGEFVRFENDYIQLEPKDTFYLNYLRTIDGDELYSVREVDRVGAMFVLFGVFAASVDALALLL